ncbi:hypothetical protein [Microbacterium sp. YY-01]|uniref:hypothetical protein n=1 Tax=Microbacterium sp. YY-01 TaxID=3421634 RepID=UPI003D18375D
MALRVGVLHTVPALAPAFDRMLLDGPHKLEIIHVADASLLARAIAHGITDDVRDDLRRHLHAFHDSGADYVLVTCSSIGEAAVEAARSGHVAVTRVDAAMAAEAVSRARAGNGSIVVLATLTATLGPTTRLVEACADAAGENVTVTATVVDGAAAARAEGDNERHDELIRQAVAAAPHAEVIVLAQASMADAVGAGAIGTDARIVSSPTSGARAFLAGLPR